MKKVIGNAAVAIVLFGCSSESNSDSLGRKTNSGPDADSEQTNEPPSSNGPPPSGLGGAGVDAPPTPPSTPSDGCGAQSESGTFHRTVQVNGSERRYFVSVPETYAPNNQYPLILGYHGGDDFGGEAMQGYLGLEEVPPLDQEIFVYPDATAVSDPSGTGFEYGVGQAGQAEDAFFDAIVETMSAEYCIDRSRIFAVGQSAGGGYVAQLGCHRGNVLRAVVPVAANIVLCGDSNCNGWGETHPSLCTGTPEVMQMHSPEDWIEYNPFGLGTFEYLASAGGCGVWISNELQIADLQSLPMSPTNTPSCEQRQGCDQSMILCSYSGGHQIPGWDGPSEFEFAPVTMEFFRSF